MRLSSLAMEHPIASMGIYQKTGLLSKQAGSLNMRKSQVLRIKNKWKQLEKELEKKRKQYARKHRQTTAKNIS